jgi:hypothetical protein
MSQNCCIIISHVVKNANFRFRQIVLPWHPSPTPAVASVNLTAQLPPPCLRKSKSTFDSTLLLYTPARLGSALTRWECLTGFDFAQVTLLFLSWWCCPPELLPASTYQGLSLDASLFFLDCAVYVCVEHDRLFVLVSCFSFSVSLDNFF